MTLCKKMKNLSRALIISLLLVSCGDDMSAELDHATVAFRELKEAGDKDSFLIIRNDEDQQYIQFEINDGVISFDRPILAASEPTLPKVASRFYKPTKSRPIIENAKIHHFISPSEAQRTKEYLERWKLSTETVMTATEDENGQIVEYFESFHGSFSVPESKLSEFLIGYFSVVFGIKPEKQTLTIKTEEA